jgi:hypothetical protein
MLELIGVFGIKMKNLSIEKFLIHYKKIDSMKVYTSYLCFLIVFLITSCEQPVRDLNPESLEGGFQLLDAKTTGIDFDSVNARAEGNNRTLHSFLFFIIAYFLGYFSFCLDAKRNKKSRLQKLS